MPPSPTSCCCTPIPNPAHELEMPKEVVIHNGDTSLMLILDESGLPGSISGLQGNKWLEPVKPQSEFPENLSA